MLTKWEQKKKTSIVLSQNWLRDLLVSRTWYHLGTHFHQISSYQNPPALVSLLIFALKLPKMLPMTPFFILLCLPSLSFAIDAPRTPPNPFWRRSSSSKTKSVPAAGYYPPADNGGSMLTVSARLSVSKNRNVLNANLFRSSKYL